MINKKNEIVIIIALISFTVFCFYIRIKKEQEYNNFPKKEELSYAIKENKDTIGWVYIPKTNINYPIMFGENFFYNDHNIYKTETSGGSIYSMYDKKTQNIVISGHNSRTSMINFNWLHNIKDVSLGLDYSCYQKNSIKLEKHIMPNFNNKEDQIWYISAFGIEGKWQIWAMYETPMEEDENTQFYNIWYNKELKEKEEIEEWINYQLKRSEYDFETEVNYKDQFLTIYTCGCQYYEEEDQSKLYFFLKKI